MSIIIIFLILFGIVVHRYLTPFFDENRLPNRQGFMVYLFVFLIGCLINTIWMFGIFWGIVGALMIFFQIIYISVLWVFLVPHVKATIKSIGGVMFRTVNMQVYRLWSVIPVSILVLGIINFFVSDYKDVSNYIIETIGATLFLTILISVIIVGNLIRIIVLRGINKEPKDTNKHKEEDAFPGGDAFREHFSFLWEEQDKPNYYAIFDETYNKVSEQLETTKITNHANMELLPFMLFLCYYATNKAGKDVAIVDEIMRRYQSRGLAFLIRSGVFENRSNLYAGIANGKPLRPDWKRLIDEEIVTGENVIARLIIALVDVLTNPDCACNYENAPMPIFDEQNVLDFSKIMVGVSAELMDFFEKIYKA